MDEPVTEIDHENDFENGGDRNLGLRACGAIFPWLSEQGSLTLSISKADAQARVYIRGYAARAAYYGRRVSPGTP